MADIELVIRISQEDYETIRSNSIIVGGMTIPNVFEAIRNGVHIPKGHGRLIDETEADGIIAEGKDGNKAYFGTVNKDWEVIDFLKTVPTIIEAESEIKG